MNALILRFNQLTAMQKSLVVALMLHMAVFFLMVCYGFQSKPHIHAMHIDQSDMTEVTLSSSVPTTSVSPQPVLPKPSATADQSTDKKKPLSHQPQHRLKTIKSSVPLKKTHINHRPQHTLHKTNIPHRSDHARQRLRSKLKAAHHMALPKTRPTSLPSHLQHKTQPKSQTIKSHVDAQHHLTVKKKAEESLNRAIAKQRDAMMQAEKHTLSQSHQAYLDQQQLAQWQDDILSMLSRFWRVPADSTPSMHVILNVKLHHSGEVADVIVSETSGSDAFDRSAKLAVWKASPLPLPKDPRLIDSLLHFRLNMSPKHIIA